MSHTFRLKYHTFTAQMYYRLIFFSPRFFSFAHVLCIVLTKSWVLTHSGPGRFSPERAWTTPASAWGHPSCPCLWRTKRQSLIDGAGSQRRGGGWGWDDNTDDTQTTTDTGDADIQARVSSLDGEVEGTPWWSLAPFSKLARIKWGWGRRWHVQTHKHDAHAQQLQCCYGECV